jgi:hypothetical protein
MVAYTTLVLAYITASYPVAKAMAAYVKAMEAYTTLIIAYTTANYPVAKARAGNTKVRAAYVKANYSPVKAVNVTIATDLANMLTNDIIL